MGALHATPVSRGRYTRSVKPARLVPNVYRLRKRRSRSRAQLGSTCDVRARWSGRHGLLAKFHGPERAGTPHVGAHGYADRRWCHCMNAPSILAVWLLASGCDRDKTTTPSQSAPKLAAPDKTPSVNAVKGPPLAPAAISKDMVLIKRADLISPFYLDINEVTVRDYRDCVEQGHCRPVPGLAPCDGFENNYAKARLDHPVNCVTELDAWRYCQYRNKRLPSAEEFQAALTRTGSKHFWGNGSPDCDAGVIAGCAAAGTSAVGSKPGGRSEEGVQDLLGNVAEIEGTPPEMAWDYPVRQPVDGPITPSQVRGGSYATNRSLLGVGLAVDLPLPEVGFRCASSLPGEPQISSH